MQKIEPSLLLVWARVAQLRNLQAAGKSLFLSQPAISHQLKRLQDWLGEPLYHRTARGIEPTEIGRILQRTGENMEAVLQEAQAVRDKTKDLLRGTLRLSASHTNAEYLLPLLVGEYCRKYPAVNVRTATMNSQQAWLHRDEVDLLLIESAEDLVREPVEWTRTTLIETEISALVPVSHPLAALTAIPLEDLASEKLIWREEGSGIREDVIHAFRQAGIYPYIHYEFSGLAAVRSAVRNGIGIGFSSTLLSPEQLVGVRLIPVVPSIPHTLSVLHRTHYGHLVASFLEVIRLSVFEH